MSRKGITYLITFILMGVSGESTAGNLYKGDTILNFKIERESAVGRSLREYYTAGPSTMHFTDSVSYSSAALTANIEQLERPIVVQCGRGHNLYGLSADTYYKLSPDATVRGYAAYHSGKTRDIALCDVIDYELLAPFVIGDDTGGDLLRQSYDFGGGWGCTYTGWSIGINAGYRAKIAHRQVDPRVRNIVSDLNVGIGCARHIGQRHLLGLNCGMRVYHQDTDVDFYNPVSHAITMVYTGMGGTSSRFKGADAQATSNRLTGFNASLLLVPTTHSDSFYAALETDVCNADLILKGYNNLKFGTVSTKSVCARISRLVTAGPLSVFPTLSAAYTNRVATENLFGSSADNYEKIGQRKNYHHMRTTTALSVPVSWHISRHKTLVSADLRLSYLNDEEYILDPDRRRATDYLSEGITLEATKQIGNHWAVGAKLGYEMSARVSNVAEGGINASRALKSMVLTLKIRYARLDYKGLSDGNNLTAGLSLTF